MGLSNFERLEGTISTTLPNHGPTYDSLAREVNLVRYDKQGDINYTMLAETLIQVNDSLAELCKPQIKMVSQRDVNWRFTANSGTILSPGHERYEARGGSNSETIELTGDVEIYRFNLHGEGEILYTDFLTYYTGDRTLQTDRDVRIVSSSSVITATGMYYQLNLDNLELLDDVEVNRIRSNTDDEIIYTDYLSYDRSKEIMTTHRQVTIVTKGSKLTSTGMRYELLTQTLNLLSDGHAHYENQ